MEICSHTKGKSWFSKAREAERQGVRRIVLLRTRLFSRAVPIPPRSTNPEIDRTDQCNLPTAAWDWACR
jgi:hypothetical protein